MFENRVIYSFIVTFSFSGTDLGVHICFIEGLKYMKVT